MENPLEINDYFNQHFCKNFDDILFEKIKTKQLEAKESLSVEAFKNYNAMAIWRNNPKVNKILTTYLFFRLPLMN